MPPSLIQIGELNISRNFLPSIDILCSLTKLRRIIANDNYIKSVNLVLDKLRDLDLRNNYLVRIPNLKELPSLQNLNLSANKIFSFKLQITDQNLITMEKIDLSSNKLSYESGN